MPLYIFENVSFSTKKARHTPKNILPPKPPIKSCPPVSRLNILRNENDSSKNILSFFNKNGENQTSHYDENNKKLFFEQCFMIEGHLGSGSYGKVY